MFLEGTFTLCNEMLALTGLTGPITSLSPRSWIFKIHKKIVSLTELMAGVKAPSKTCQLFQLMCWPQGYKVPTSTNALVELMNMVERWRQRTDYGPVVVVSQDGIGRCGVYCAANACIEQVIQHGEVDVFQAVKTVRRHRPQLVQNLVRYLVSVYLLYGALLSD